MGDVFVQRPPEDAVGQRGDEQVSSTLEMNAAVKEIEAFSLGFGLRTERKDTAKLFRDALGHVAHAEDLNCHAEPIEVVGITTYAEELCMPAWLRGGAQNRGTLDLAAWKHSPKIGFENSKRKNGTCFYLAIIL